MDEEAFRHAFKNSPMKRAKRRGLKRNAAVVLGNVGTTADADALREAVGDADPVVAAHAAWALRRISSSSA
jgi:epoxyqueuosine reductase